VYFVPWEQAAITVFDRKAVNIGGPAINDSGSIALASRDVTSHPLRDEWLSCAGQTAELLPELNEYRLRNEIAIDGAGRVVGTFEYRTDVATTQKVMRYNSAGTWEKLLDSSNEELVGLIGGQPINYRGDFIYASSLRTDVGVEHWLNLFDSTTNAPRRLVQYSGDIQTVRAKIADTGDALLTIRTPYETDVFRYEADNGTVTDLSTLLPAGHSLALQQLPQMNYKGEVVFGTTSALGYSYFSLDATGENLNRSVLLENLQLQEYALSDFGQLYFWLSTPNEAFLGMVTIPEPSTMLLVFVAACGMVNLRRGKNRHFV